MHRVVEYAVAVLIVISLICVIFGFVFLSVGITGGVGRYEIWGVYMFVVAFVSSVLGVVLGDVVLDWY